MSYIEPLISKIIDDNAVPTLDSLGLDRDFFPVGVERDAYDFVRKYSTENAGQAPSYAAIVTEIPDFTYVPDVTDSYTYMARKVKETWAKLEADAFISGHEHVAKFSEIGRTITFEEYNIWLTDGLNRIRMRTYVRKNVGTSVATVAETFLTEYYARKDGKSFKIWPSKFPTINAAIGGGYFGGNIYTWFARSGRGKSIMTMEEAIESAFRGAIVLVWAMEMPLYEYMTRAFTSISGRLGLVSANVDGTTYDEAGFDNRAMLAGKLSADMETELESFVRTINEHITGQLIVRAVDDPEFIDRSVRALEADIRETAADVVVIDPIYYMDYEANTSKTAGGDVAATSQAIRRLAGRTRAVIHIITQADEDKSEKDDEGVRELKPPARAEIKKTKAVLEDAAVTIAFDSLANEGRGKYSLGKGRSGGEDTSAEIIFLPNYGIVREPDIEDVASKFVGIF